MKTTNYICILTAILVLSACDFLEEKPESFISAENFYKTKSDAIAAVTAAYAPNKTNGDTNRNFNILGDITTDDVSPLLNNNDRVQLDQYTHTPQNTILRETWQNFYLGINRCNIVISRVPLIQMEEPLRDRLVAEAKFLRGFYYFHLVRLFGKVPLVVEETTSLTELTYPQREEADVIYQQIIKDFQDAEAVLPISYTGADRGRATKGAAKSYLALVYLTLKQYQLAADKALEVMQPEFGYGLWEKYSDVFAISNEFGKEAIFDAQFISGPSGQGSNLIAFWAQENNSIAGRGFGSFQPTEDIYKAFDPADLRLPVFFVKGTDGKYYCNKWIDADAITANQSDNNFPHIRFAEVLLIFAEASNEVTGEPSTEAYAAINSIRKRAGLPDLENLTKDEFREAVLNERRLELCFEGHRWYDLVRTDRLVSTLQAKGITNVQEYHKVFPVPQLEIDLNQTLKPQNDGYPQ
jgi:hypothetical protein